MPPRRQPVSLVVCLIMAVAVPASIAEERIEIEAVLPPLAPWDGASRALALTADDPWATPFERRGLTASPSYDETVSWLERLAAASPQVRLVTIGHTWEGRAIVMVVASVEGAGDPAALHASGRPVLLVQAGIHSGEIDGKDAGMMLLRDLTVRGTLRERLARASLLFIPVLNVDGHERRSAWGRINQRGPVETGWRTNARNQNLNRDYAKLDTPEVQALVGAVEQWRPDLYVDVHVTDGVDWQYDVTWGANGASSWSPAIGRWLAERLGPPVTAALERAGHVPGPLVFPDDDRDLGRGVTSWTADVRYSNGWGDARHLPTILVENHSLKPFDRRVLGTHVFLDAVLDVLGRHAAELRHAVAEDRARRPHELPLAWKVPTDVAAERRPLLAIEQRAVPSAISGGVAVQWTGEPVTLEVPRSETSAPAATATRPRAYWIPPVWPEVLSRLVLQGITLESIDQARTVEVEALRVTNHKLEPQPFEGRARVSEVEVQAERRRETFPPGSVRVTCDQPLGDLAILLLEPTSPDSFFRWGFFLEVLQQAEYAEAYVMEATAERMLGERPELAAEFRERLLRDAAFAADPQARLDWFYRRTPYFDERFRLYPVARETANDVP